MVLCKVFSVPYLYMKEKKYYITYFYNIRFLSPDIIPISTALSDPKWYKGKPRLDSRGVVVGLNFPELHYPDGFSCGCPCENKDPSKCRFLKTYKNHLFSLDWDILMKKIDLVIDYYNALGVCLVVYETPDNPCSERGSLVELWKSHGLELIEFTVHN